jgi:MoaA/NifB/PqqE/SkfB family radical SAM enzyme
LLSLNENHDEILSILHSYELKIDSVLKKLVDFKLKENNFTHNRFTYANIYKYWEKYKSLILIKQEFLEIIKRIREEHTKCLDLIQDIEYQIILKEKNDSIKFEVYSEVNYDKLPEDEKNNLRKKDFKTFYANEFDKDKSYNFVY